MKKWGRKKASSSSSISNVFLKQWLSRFNNTKCCEQAEPFRTKLNNISSFQSCKEDHGDDGFYWSLSFDEEMDEDDKLNVSPVSHGSFNNTLSNGAKIKELITSDREKLDSNVKINGNKRRRSKHGRKVKHSSPLTVDKDRVVEDAFRTGLDSFAIVKTSFDPGYDFRESMIEMIIEKEIKKPEELEELLACYLTLNCDEYHELIVNVFKRVWIELNRLHFYQFVE